ncbi:MAG: N-acyl homoserine lactonase family protein [Halodesulfurarchaeum sp.]
MTTSDVIVLERGTVRSDARHVLEGYQFGTREAPEPDTIMGTGPIYNVLIDHPEATLLWDTGAHPAAEDRWTDEQYDHFEFLGGEEARLEPSLLEAGYAIESIDGVIQSHLHFDHAGGLHHFAGGDVPIYVHERELEHAYLSSQTDRGGKWYDAKDFHHDLQWDLVQRKSRTLYEGIEVFHLPGHTPGLLGVEIAVQNGAVLLISDHADLRLNYEEAVPMSGGMIWNKEAWYESLEHVRTRAQRVDGLVVAGHDADDLERLRNLF